MQGKVMEKADCSGQWKFLEDELEPCCVVTWRMEVVYMNTPARSLVPEDWFGCRCWEIFPVKDQNCAANCPAIQAVSRGEDIVYCEETLYPSNGSSVTIGVAVIPTILTGTDRGGAVLLIRPRSENNEEKDFERNLLERAGQLRRKFS